MHGAAYEIVDDCRHDIIAWLDFLADRGYHRNILLGHSLGAIKAAYSQAYASHPSVRGVIACSPPRLSYSAYMNSDTQPRFFESFTEARQHVERGQPNSLILSKFPASIWVTAAGYLDKYGPQERYNILHFVDRLMCPLLATYGTLELLGGGIAFAGMDDQLLAHRRADQPVQIATIAGADHAYTNCYDRLTAAIGDWLAATSKR
jgi:pimeloyl-ACP methyl ester carboxylesterase